MNTSTARRGPIRLAMTGAFALVALVAAAWILSFLPGSLNPFRTSSVDRSSPIVVKSIADLGQYRAATANLQFVVDVERDTRFVPSFIKGDRTLFVASGAVDAGVDFSTLPADAITVSEKDVAVRLPAVRLYPAQVDLSKSYVADRKRGLLDRIGSVVGDGSDQRHVYTLAQRKLSEGAAQDERLMARAEANTERMLKDLLKPLGFSSVTVTFEAPPTA